MPRWQLFNGRLGSTQSALCAYLPLDFFGIFFKDDYFEVVEGKYFAQLIGENSRQLLARLTRKKGLAYAKHGLVALRFALDKHVCAHLFYEQART